MKNSTKKLTSILMIAAMVFVLFGCGNSGASDAERFVGTWKGTIDMTDLINESIQQDFAEDDGISNEDFTISEFNLAVVFTFSEDGTYSAGVDETSLNQSINTFKEEFKEIATRYFEDLIEEMEFEMSVDDVLAASGVTMDSLVDEAFPESMIDGLLDERGKWEVQNGKLYTSESVNDNVDKSEYDLLYEFTSDGIKLFLPEEVEDDTGFFPLILKKA